MTLKHNDRPRGPAIVPITFLLDDPASLSTDPSKERRLKGGTVMSLLELALENGINIEHMRGE